MKRVLLILLYFFSYTSIQTVAATANAAPMTADIPLQTETVQTTMEAETVQTSPLNQAVLATHRGETVQTSQSTQQVISGTVTDALSSEPLVGANILLEGSGSGTTTDSQGEFSLTVPDRDGEITISYLGYESRTYAIRELDQDADIRLLRTTIPGGEVFVQALRVDESIPIAYSNISREELDEQNLGKELPYLVSTTPSVVTTSDAGAGIGHTGIRIRGVDATRINVTINGVPVNDSESHGVFWVNMPDLASSVDNIQIQRGVGSSTHGAGAFGGTMNIQTARMEDKPYAEVNTSLGSFNTRSHNILLGSGNLGDGWQLEGRYSDISSDGYIDRATSDLESLYLSGSRRSERSILKVDILSGNQRTYQAWNGVPEPILNNDPEQLEHYISNLGGDADRLRENLGNRRFNEFTYHNQTDNYRQDHYQLHYSRQLTDNWLLNSSLHYTYGRGYYEQYREDDPLLTYQIDPVQIGETTITESDLIRRRWLDNHFFGGLASLEWQSDNTDVILGGGYNEYDGDHFGEVIWARFAGQSEYEDRYYENNGYKTDGNVYGKVNHFLNDRLSVYADMQYRNVSYRFLGLHVDETGGGQDILEVEQQVRIHFFNPKAGVVYRLGDHSRVFASLSVGGKEPTRRDYIESTPESRPDPERLFDYELGYNGRWGGFSGGLNLYYMHYRDQLILTGAVNDVGAYTRENVARSYRAGVEIHGSVELTPWLNLDANATLSRNKIPEYTFYLDNFDTGGQERFDYDDVDIAFSPALTGNGTLRYQKGNLSAAFITKYVSRQYMDNTQTLSRSIDPYVINDLRVGYSLSDVPWFDGVNLTLLVNNLFNRSYVDNGYTFGWIAGGDQQHFNYYFPQAGRSVMARVSFNF